MRKKLKVIFAALAVSALGLTAAACDVQSTPAEKQDAAYISGISLRYNGEDIKGGALSLDLDSEEHAFTADVIRTGSISGDVTYDSSDKAVATVADDGTMTLVGIGETVVTATAEADSRFKAYVAVTVTGDEEEQSYKITVVGGEANVSEAAEGTIVTLTPQPPEGMGFTGWKYSVDDLWINGNTFRMPASDITVTAEYGQTLSYRLEVQDGTYVAEGVAQGERIPYGTKVTLTSSVEPEEGMKLAGWTTGDAELDEKLGIDGNSFTMPGRNISLMPVFGYIDYNISVEGGEAFSKTAHIGDSVTILPDSSAVPAGKILLGWKGLDGDNILYSNTFEMPASDVSLTPVYGRSRTASLSSSYDYGSGSSGSASEVEIDGVKGRSYAFASNAGKGSKLRIKGGGVPYGPAPVVMEITLRNNNQSDITLEYTLDYYAANYSTGVSTIKGGTTSKLYLYVPEGELDESDADDGVASPYHVMFLREALNEESYFYLDVAVRYMVLDGGENVQTYNLSVMDGNYSVEGGYSLPAEGDKVTLTPDVKEGYVFSGWKVVKGDVEIEDNIFVMPAGDVEIEAQYTQLKSYSVTVTGGTSSVKEAYEGDTVTAVPDESLVPEGQIFVGWKGVLGGDALSFGQTFKMPASNVTLTPVYAAAEKAPALGTAMDNGTGTSQITNKYTTGLIDGESADFYELSAAYTAGTLVRIRGGNIFTGSADQPGKHQVAAVTFKNDGAYDITFNLFLENTARDEEGNDLYKYNIAETGNITVKAGQTVTVYMDVPVDNTGATPYPCIKFASDIGGKNGETFKLGIYVRLSDVSALE